MWYQLLTGGLVSLVNFAIHVCMTGLIVVVTRHIAGRTDDLHVFMRLTALQFITLVVLAIAHVTEIAVWAAFYRWAGVTIQHATSFEFAFENYTALGYGDALGTDGWRLIGPITSLNGLLLIGISVAIIFEVNKMVDIQIVRPGKRTR
jgi:hypothetical protein